MATSAVAKYKAQFRMTHGRIALAGLMAAMLAVTLVGVSAGREKEVRKTAAPSPALSVALTPVEASTLPIRIAGAGNVVAWQEATVGAEADGLRLTGVEVNVGDTVTRGQVLALFDASILQAELAEARASVSQAEAEAEEAQVNALRAKKLESSGAMSAQQINQYVVAAATAHARLDVARAVEKRQRLRLLQTRVLAPSDGVITSRTATVGAVAAAGQELFRLIKEGRLEWRAEVAAADVAMLAPGQRVTISAQGHAPIRGTLRIVAPAINMQTRSALVYVDLPGASAILAGTFAQGYFEVGQSPALTVPEGAVLLRDGFHYVMSIGAESKVAMRKVAVGRRIEGRIEITEGLAAAENVIASGVSFLSEGDTVDVVSAIPIVRKDEHAPLARAGRQIRMPARSGL